MKINRVPLLTAMLATRNDIDRVEVKRIDFAPLQKTGVHFHPCPVIGYIAKGLIYFQIEGEEAKILKEGTAFFEPANKKVLHFDNLSEKDGVSFIAVYLLKKDDKELIKMLE